MLNNSRWLQVLIIELVIIATLYLLQLVGGLLAQFANIGLLFFLAWLLAFALRPLIRTLVRVGSPKPLAVLFVYIALIFAFVGIGLVVVPTLIDQLQTRQRNWDNYVTQANTLVAAIQDGLQTTTGQKVDLDNLYRTAIGQVQTQAGTILSNAVSWLSTAAGLLFNMILIILLSVYIAFDGDRLATAMTNALPVAWRDEAVLVGDSIGRSFGGFLRGQVIFAAIYGILNAAIMAALGIDLMLPVSIIAGFCMLIPLIGNFLAFIPPVLVAVLTPATTDKWWVVLGLLFLMQSAMMQIIGPRIMSSAVGIHPLFTVLAMLIGAQVAGVWGALFGIPVAGVIGLVTASFLGRVKQFFNAPETSPVIGMIVAPAPVPAEGEASLTGPPVQPTGAIATLPGAALPLPPVGSPAPAAALLRGLTRLATAARRTGKH